MHRILTSKWSFENGDVTRVWENVGDYVTPGEAERAVDLAVAEVRATCGQQLGNVAYGWSGGKDSMALQVVMERAGVHRCMLGIIPHLEFRQYLTWVDAHRPEGLEIIRNTSLTLPWLGQPRNARYLFPRTSKDGYFWTLASARHAQQVYHETRRPALQIYGRRTQDGNICGPLDTGLRKGRVMTVYNPLRAWPHELVLAVVRYAGRPLPPVYSWPHGWTAGTGSWPGRRVGTLDESWAETYAIEPDRVREAAEHVPAAAAWLAASATS